MFSAGVFIVSLALIRACVWFCFNFVSLLPFLTFLFICRGGWGGKPQCFIFYLLTDLKKFWQLSCFITIYELLLRGKLFFKSLILTRTTTISIVHFYCYSIISFFIVSLTWHDCTFVIVSCCCCCRFFISFIISRWIVLKLSLVLLRKCISY